MFVSVCVCVWTHNQMRSKIRGDGRNNEKEKGMILTKCNDYRFQCNILYNAVINDANNKYQWSRLCECSLGTCKNVSLYFLTASWKNFSRAVIPVFRNIKTKPLELNIGLKFMTEETSPIPDGGFWTIFKFVYPFSNEKKWFLLFH